MIMNKSKIIVCIFLWFVSGSLMAQKKAAFFLQPQITFINGAQTVDGSLGLVTGAEKGPWQFGLGSALDYYQFRTVPVFAEVKRFFGNQSKKPFVYAGAGFNFPWLQENERYYIYDWWGSGPVNEADYETGYYVHGGIGCWIQNKKGKGFSLSLGFSKKTNQINWMENVWDPSTSLITTTPRSKKYDFNRLDFKLGFRLF